MRRLRLHITGTVQGVGFRPYIHRLARECELTGAVWNEGGAVFIEIQGPELEEFLARLPRELPPLARIKNLEISECPLSCESSFLIRPSGQGGSGDLFITPDAALCEDCQRELFDPADRRFRYPFINCTNCGPRFTITRGLPYDRSTTSMAVFPLCKDCAREYEDPTNRRFHAQPNACSTCGPRLGYSDGHSMAEGEEALQASLRLLQSGGILALRGLGGYHLAVNARDEEAVQRLRDRKQRWTKPLAVMTRNVETATTFAILDAQDISVLQSVERPILLLPQRRPWPLASSLAPGNTTIGIMLPYTPLHHLLLADSSPVLVMTSGNISEEPICIGVEEAEKRLSGIADGFLHHDRDILQRCDDSVLRFVAGAPSLIRRSRGFVPRALDLPVHGPAVVAVGGELKNTLCLASSGSAWLSQHIGDCERPETLDFLEEALSHLMNVLHVQPTILVHDLHPSYLSTRWAKEWSHHLIDPSVPRYGVQHHHAHFASCLAEHGVRAGALGIILDGAGYGEDGTIRGGEFLAGPPEAPTRFAGIPSVPLPGGDVAVREPWRMAASWLHEAAGEEGLDILRGLALPVDPLAWETVVTLLRHPSGLPRSSGAGRVFDAASAILGLGTVAHFEAQGAMALESLAASVARTRIVPSDDIRGPASILLALARGVGRGEDPAWLAARFHANLARWCADTVQEGARTTGLTQVALSGGVFQNALFSELLHQELVRMNLIPLHHRQVPANDGGLALGQAYIAICKKGE